MVLGAFLFCLGWRQKYHRDKLYGICVALTNTHLLPRIRCPEDLFDDFFGGDALVQLYAIYVIGRDVIIVVFGCDITLYVFVDDAKRDIVVLGMLLENLLHVAFCHNAVWT